MSVGAVVACCALAACTQEPVPASTASSTPAATTPTESQIERQMRLDYEAAEKAYRANIAEQDGCAQAGGDRNATAALKATADGVVSADQSLRSLRVSRDAGWRANGTRQSSASCESVGRGTCQADQLRGQQPSCSS